MAKKNAQLKGIEMLFMKYLIVISAVLSVFPLLGALLADKVSSMGGLFSSGYVGSSTTNQLTLLAAILLFQLFGLLGFFKMQKWGLYLFTGTVALQILMSLQNFQLTATQLIPLGLIFLGFRNQEELA